MSDNQLILDFKASKETNKLPALFIPILEENKYIDIDMFYKSVEVNYEEYF